MARRSIGAANSPPNVRFDLAGARGPKEPRRESRRKMLVGERNVFAAIAILAEAAQIDGRNKLVLRRRGR